MTEILGLLCWLVIQEKLSFSGNSINTGKTSCILLSQFGLDVKYG